MTWEVLLAQIVGCSSGLEAQSPVWELLCPNVRGSRTLVSIGKGQFLRILYTVSQTVLNSFWKSQAHSILSQMEKLRLEQQHSGRGLKLGNVLFHLQAQQTVNNFFTCDAVLSKASAFMFQRGLRLSRTFQRESPKRPFYPTLSPRWSVRGSSRSEVRIDGSSLWILIKWGGRGPL